MYWYVRSQNKVNGPFPGGQIQQSILLGRVSLSDLVSTDKEEWTPIRQCPELIPDVLKGSSNDENRKERIKAAKRWADERRGERREDTDPTRLAPGRRSEEPYTTSEYRQHREATAAEIRAKRDRNVLGLIVIVLVIIGGVIVAFKLPPPVQEDAQCDSPAKPKINWSHCQLIGLQSINSKLNESLLSNANLESANLLGSNMSNSDLSYANLKNANLSFTELTNTRMVGVDLRGADLSKANLSKADLAYANLKGAKISKANFKQTILSNAIWIDGRKCQAPSIGECKTH